MTSSSKPTKAGAAEQQPPVAVPIAAKPRGQWKVSVTGAKTSLTTDCCPCATLNATMSRVTKFSLVYTVLFGLFYTAAMIVPIALVILQPFWSWDWAIALLGLVVMVSFILAAARAKVRSAYDIPGNLFGDCWWSFWCTTYTVAQMRTQVEDDAPATDVALPAYHV